jgi:hypothetical protein
VPSREPSNTHIFPAGGRRGTVVPVLVGGECLPPGANFRIWSDGVSAPDVLGTKVQARTEPSPRRLPREVPICYPKEWESQITIAADAPVGTAMWRITCARGGTGTRPFIVGDLPEFIETESNSLPQRAERVKLPVTINGRIAGEYDRDYFVFAADAGAHVVIDVVAARIGSPLDAVVEVRAPNGRRVDVEEQHIGADPLLRFTAPTTGDYQLTIAHVGFQGSPAHVYRMTVLTQPSAVSPAAAGDSLREHEPNDSASTGEVLQLPATVAGQFLSPLDQDWFSIDAKKDAMLSIVCRPATTGGPTLPFVSVLDAKGTVVAGASSVDSPQRRCWIDWTPPADDRYLIRLRDVQHGVRGGTDFGYVLSVQPAAPDFSLALASDFTNVVQGGKSELAVTIERTGGFTGAVDVLVEGAPPGVATESLQIAPTHNTAKLVLAAADDARPTDAVLRVIGRAKIGDAPQDRTAVAPHAGRDAEGVSIGSPTANRLFLTVQHKPVFRLQCTEDYRYAHRGTVYPYEMQVERLDGFDGEIVLQLGDRQNRDVDGVEFWEVAVPPGHATVKLPIYLPETMHINVLSQSQIYAQGYAVFTDKWGQRQATLVVSEKRCMIRTMPTVAKLSVMDKSLVARPGTSVRCTLQLDRTSNFTDVLDVELIAPTAQAGFTADRVRIGPDQSTAEVAVRVAADVVSRTVVALRLRGRGKMPGGEMVVTEATVPVTVE